MLCAVCLPSLRSPCSGGVPSFHHLLTLTMPLPAHTLAVCSVCDLCTCQLFVLVAASVLSSGRVLVGVGAQSSAAHDISYISIMRGVSSIEGRAEFTCAQACIARTFGSSAGLG